MTSEPDSRSAAISTDPANGWDAIAARFIEGRAQSRIGVSMVTSWSRALPPGAEVLDVGCGFGVPLSQALLQSGFRVHGVDASPQLIAEFRRRFPAAPAHCMAAEALDLGRRFDAIVAVGLLFLLAPATQREVIAKLAGHLKPGGHLLFTAPWQVCTWQDLLTGRQSVSLGREAYLAECAEHGLGLLEEGQDDGENHYYSLRMARD